MFKSISKKVIIINIIMLSIFLLAGCGKQAGNGTKVVLTTGFEKDEIFRIESISCKLPEIMVYLTNSQNQYEGVFGSEIWAANVEGITLEQNVKDTALARIAQIKTMNLLADQHGVELSEQEAELARQAGAFYYQSLNETEREKMGVTESNIYTLYAEYALANKVYNYIIKDINPEISDDEARTITVQHLLIKTYTLDGTGAAIGYSQSAKAEAYEKAKEALKLAKEGTDFEELIKKYSEDNYVNTSNGIYSFGKGDMEDAFEEAAFNLGKDEISDIIETEYGYHVIKCINTFNKEETDANKIKIMAQRKKEVFGQEYDTFVNSLTRQLNEELWDNVTFIHDQNVKTADFFDVYSEFFKE